MDENFGLPESETTYPGMGNTEVMYSELVGFRGKVPIGEYFVTLTNGSGTERIKVPATKVEKYRTVGWIPRE